MGGHLVLIQMLLTSAQNVGTFQSFKPRQNLVREHKKMGAAHSSGQVQLNTPKASKEQGTVMVNDPRSPSDAIKRTPMRVLPSQIPAVDPRSPSQQIYRTPLQPEQENSSEKRLDEVRVTLDYENSKVENKSQYRSPLTDKNL